MIILCCVCVIQLFSYLSGSSYKKTCVMWNTMEKVNNNSSPRPEKIFDAHIHFWDLKKRREYVPQNPSFDWPNNSTPGIFKNYLPQDYSHVPFHDAIFVQALNQCPQEIEWAQELCKSSAPFIKGIVGGLDFTKPDNMLEYISMYRKGKCPLIGLRHILDADKDPQGFFEREDVLKSLELIDRSNLDMTVDLVLRPHNLYIASNLASKYPSIRFMIDHIAKPQMSSDGLSSRHETWMREMKKASNHSNVYAKISGLINEVDPNVRKEDAISVIQPFTDFVLESFGSKRFVFGSDWPVSIDSSYEYDDVIRLADGLLSHLSVSEREDIFYNNGIGFYGIKDL